MSSVAPAAILICTGITLLIYSSTAASNETKAVNATFNELPKDILTEAFFSLNTPQPFRLLEPDEPVVEPCIKSPCVKPFAVPITSLSCPSRVKVDRPVEIAPALASYLSKNIGVHDAVGIVEIDGTLSASVFFVSQDLAITNWHVIKRFADQMESNWYAVRQKVKVRLLMGSSLQPSQTLSLSPGMRILATEKPDLAVLHVPRGSGPWLKLGRNSDIDVKPETYNVVMIGFSPVFGIGEGHALALYGTCGDNNIKNTIRAQIGRLQDRFAGEADWQINYTFNTFGGNSGSPVMRTDNSLVVAVHFQESAGQDLPNHGVAADDVHSLVDRFLNTPPNI